MSGERFNEDYFERGESTGVSLYSNYRWMPEKTIALAHSIVNECTIRYSDHVLDWGCAKGYLVRSLRLLHHTAWGYDISEYALSQAPDDVRNLLFKSLTGTLSRMVFDWIIAKDVLEHMEKDQLGLTLEWWRKHCKHSFVIVPLGNGQKYNCAEYEKDATHIIREDLQWWREQFEKAGFRIRAMTTDLPFVKISRCDDSDGFFRLERR